MTTTSTNKQHFAILDGMRGIAALGVVIFHFMECAITDYSKNFIGHGFLAVDFFFCLSGFVIGYAYDNRIGQMSAWQFFKLRLIRLHPLVIFGSVLGLLSWWLDPFAANTVVYTAGKLLFLFLCSLLLIPMPVMEDRYFNQFGFNAPAWSLFWEYIANIFYAFVLHKVGKRLLIILVAIAAVGIGLVAYRATNLMGGWGKDNTWDGGVRVAYSFLAGLLVYRFNWIIKNKLGFIGLSMLLAAALLMPFFKYNWLAETLVVLFYFPLLVSLGAGSTLSPRLKKACDFSGNMSYPLYMTHYAGIWIFANYYNTYKPGNGKLALVIIGGTTIMILTAWAVMKWYDTPVRKYLINKFR
ncbi:MAG: acyltransferase [Niastella sp.]|nr:acyltransferase [Niastella sp.]